jgi:GAF domain-containing protein/CHASE1-domain containing sensor protein
VVAVIVIGTTAAWGIARDDEHDAAAREQLVADQTANLVASTVQQLLAAISGVSGLPDDSGEVDAGSFAAYAREAVNESPFTTLAYAPAVPAAERAEFEAAIGRPVTDAPGGPPAGRRDEYVPVRLVVPPSEATESLIGYDVAHDPVRRRAVESARDLGVTVITETIASQPDGEAAVFVVHPVYRSGTDPDASVAARRRALLGYVSTSVHGDALLDAVGAQVTEPLGIRIEDVPAGGRGPAAVLAETRPAPEGGATAERGVGGRGWLVAVDDRQPVHSNGPLWLMTATAALTLALAVLAWRAARHQHDVDLHVATVERIAGLGRALAAAGTVSDLHAVIRAEVPRVLHAATARFHDRPPPGASVPAAGPDDTVVRRPIEDESGTPVAALEVVWTVEEPHSLALASLDTVAAMCGQALARARLTDRVRRDAVNSRLLAGLAEASTTAGTTDQVARSLVERVADVPGATTAQIGLATDDPRVLQVVRQGARGERQRLVVDEEEPSPLAEAYRRRRPVLVDDLRTAARRFPGRVAEMRAAGVQALACLPLVDGGGTPVGALALAWAQPQRFDDEMVDVLRTTAELCTSSLVRARATDQAQARSAALATLAASLSASTSFDDVGLAIIRHATPVLGADFALVGVVEGDRLHLIAPDAPVFDVVRSPTQPDADILMDIEDNADLPAMVAMRRRELVTFSTPEAVPDAAIAAALADSGLRGGACAPLVGSDGTVTGVFIALWSELPPFDDALVARISTVADLCAQSTERSRLFDAEHRVRRDLQHTVVVRPPEVAGVEVATRYRPATQTVGMGGDWYDAIALEGGRLCLVVGDVSGHGIGAIAEMTQLRTVVHTLVAGGMPLPEILVRTSAMMQRDELGYATLVVAVIDPPAGSLHYVTAGHPPPLVRRPGGTVDTLTGGRHSVLGIDVTPKPPGYVSFPAGSTLLMYTDGLIEQRGTVIDASIAALAAELRTLGATSADVLADDLLAYSAAAGATEDDVALVVARHTPER